MEVPTIYKALYKAYVREYDHKIQPCMVQYLHFRILEFPLSGLEIPNLATIQYGYPKNIEMCDTTCCDINAVIDWQQHVLFKYPKRYNTLIIGMIGMTFQYYH